MSTDQVNRAAKDNRLQVVVVAEAELVVGVGSPADAFKRFDGDGDGTLSSDEFNVIPEGFRNRLEGADTDGDGSVTLSEWTAKMSELRAAGGGGGGPGGNQGGSGGRP